MTTNHIEQNRTKMASKRKHSTYSLEVKYKAIQEVLKGVKSKAKISKDIGVPSNTLSTWINQKDKIISSFEQSDFEPNRVRFRKAKFEDIESALYKWFLGARAHGLPISGAILTTKAQDLAKQLGHSDFKASNGWVQRFQTRHNIVFKKVCGESKSVNTENVHEWYNTVFLDVLQNYQPRNIYNADETGIFFKLLPDKTFTFKGDTAHGMKQSKERLTAMVCANMDGSDKVPLLVIGKSAKPRCFKNQQSIPVDYKANKCAWMTSQIFTEWIKKLDAQFASENREVAMLVDNCPAHPPIDGLQAIKLVFLPPNTTSVTQPMDQGIINNLKVHYRKLLVNKMSHCIDANVGYSVNVLDALHFLRQAWSEVSQALIQNCFFKVVTDNVPPESHPSLPEPEPEAPSATDAIGPMTREDFEQYVHVDENEVCIEVLSDENIVQSVLVSKHDCDEVPENDDSTPPPTVPVAMDMLRSVRQTLGTCDHADAAFDHINALLAFLEKNRAQKAKQTSVLDFYEKLPSRK